MNEGLKVSIITIVYNGILHIEQCIQSVLAQDYPFLEYIIIDGGSTDGTVDVIKKYSTQITYWSSERDRGISDAFNKGIAKSTGDIIGLINSDDWLEENILGKVVNNFEGADIVYGRLRQVNANASYILDANHTLLLKKMSVNHPSVFVKKAVYDQHGGFDLNYKVAMDYEFLVRCYLNNVRFKYIPEVVVNFRGDGTSHHNWLRAVKEMRSVHKKFKIDRVGGFTMQVIKTYLSVFLLNSIFAPIFNLYRNKYASIKKTKE